MASTYSSYTATPSFFFYSSNFLGLFVCPFLPSTFFCFHFLPSFWLLIRSSLVLTVMHKLLDKEGMLRESAATVSHSFELSVRNTSPCLNSALLTMQYTGCLVASHPACFCVVDGNDTGLNSSFSQKWWISGRKLQRTMVSKDQKKWQEGWQSHSRRHWCVQIRCTISMIWSNWPKPIGYMGVVSVELRMWSTSVTFPFKQSRLPFQGVTIQINLKSASEGKTVGRVSTIYVQSTGTLRLPSVRNQRRMVNSLLQPNLVHHDTKLSNITRHI